MTNTKEAIEQQRKFTEEWEQEISGALKKEKNKERRRVLKSALKEQQKKNVTLRSKFRRERMERKLLQRELEVRKEYASQNLPVAKVLPDVPVEQVAQPPVAQRIPEAKEMMDQKDKTGLVQGTRNIANTTYEGMSAGLLAQIGSAFGPVGALAGIGAGLVGARVLPNVVQGRVGDGAVGKTARFGTKAAILGSLVYFNPASLPFVAAGVGGSLALNGLVRGAKAGYKRIAG